jgi:hypothetical protein
MQPAPDESRHKRADLSLRIDNAHAMFCGVRVRYSDSNIFGKNKATPQVSDYTC